MDQFNKQLGRIPAGYSEALFEGRKYGVSRKDFNYGKSTKVYAEELGGKDCISFNYYRTKKRDNLKPCEMNRKKVLSFLAKMKY